MKWNVGLYIHLRIKTKMHYHRRSHTRLKDREDKSAYDYFREDGQGTHFESTLRLLE